MYFLINYRPKIGQDMSQFLFKKNHDTLYDHKLTQKAKILHFSIFFYLKINRYELTKRTLQKVL